MKVRDQPIEDSVTCIEQVCNIEEQNQSASSSPPSTFISQLSKLVQPKKLKLETMRPLIHSKCRLLLRDNQYAEDATQETMFRAYKIANSEYMYKKFVLSIAEKVCFEIKRDRNKRILSSELTPDGDIENENNLEPKSSAAVPKRESEILEIYVKDLDELRRNILLLTMEGYTQYEMAWILNVNRSTIKYWYNKDKAELNKILQGDSSHE